MIPLADGLAAGLMLLDGGLSTELETRGHDLSGTLWSARLLRDDPASIVEVHAGFLRAGAQVLSTASYQASAEGFARAGLDDVEGALRSSVQLARRAIDEVGTPAWVAGSVGPYGAMLADGSEYTGSYLTPGTGTSVDDDALARFHRRRMAVLAEAGADVLACETVPGVREVEVLTAQLASLGVPGWLSLTTVTNPDGRVTTRLGEPAEQAFAVVRDVAEVVAVGVNCTDPTGVAAAVEVAARASGKPVLVYPNSGETWDAAARVWRGTPGLDPAEVSAWLRAGAAAIGGCCRVTPADLRALAGLRA